MRAFADLMTCIRTKESCLYAGNASSDPALGYFIKDFLEG
jgi:hypothetical protein